MSGRGFEPVSPSLPFGQVQQIRVKVQVQEVSGLEARRGRKLQYPSKMDAFEAITAIKYNDAKIFGVVQVRDVFHSVVLQRLNIPAKDHPFSAALM